MTLYGTDSISSNYQTVDVASFGETLKHKQETCCQPLVGTMDAELKVLSNHEKPELSKVFCLKPAVGQNQALHVSPTASSSVISALSVCQFIQLHSCHPSIHTHTHMRVHTRTHACMHTHTHTHTHTCLLYTSPSPRDVWLSRMPSSA